MLPDRNVLSCLAICLAIPLFGCDAMEVDSSSEAILGGTPISVGQFPTTVGIAIDQGQRGICTGTLVSPTVVLTAAHCVSPQVLGYATQAQVTQNTLVVIDATNLFQNGSIVSVASTLPRSFNGPGDPDVGIIRLAGPITDRTPTPLNLEPAKAPVGISVTMVGYGMSQVGNQGSAGSGFVLNNKISQSCASVGVSDSTFLCFNQQDGSGKCSGDSGGPSFAMIDGVQKVVGITSFGDQNCTAFGADMRVDASRSFLVTAAPELLCATDGHCDSLCGTGGVQEDLDCGAGCVVDGDCPSATDICDTNAGVCMPGPDAPGGLGSACGDGLPECQPGNVCGSNDGEQLCTRTCTVEPDSCPSGFECLAIGDEGGGACFPEGSGGGCSVGGDGRGGAAGGLLVLIALIALRRRRREVPV